MLHFIKNETLSVSVDSRGAELWDIRTCGENSTSCLWDGKPELWPRRAPICFPWCGKVDGNWFSVEGRRYEAGQHGFVRDLEHRLIEKDSEHLRFRIDWSGDHIQWPWSFSFETTHELKGRFLTTTCMATNLGTSDMPVQLGFHTGFRCPLSPGRSIQDYCIRFQRQENQDGSDHLVLTENLFENDSICFSNLQSQ